MTIIKLLKKFLIVSINKFYNSRIGGLYLEVLLWWDYRFGPDAPFRASPDFTVAQIVRNAQMIAYTRGMKNLKSKINDLAFTKDKEEYNKVLQEVQNLVALAEETDPSKIKRSELLKNMYVYKGGKDIRNDTEKAKMIQQRIRDFKQLQNHKASRQILREIRQLKKNGKDKEAKELEKEWSTKHGRR